MKILITNDDGIYAEGLIALKKELEKIAKVTVVAPDREKSAASHSLTLHKPLRMTKVKIDGDFFGFSTNGTPSDCVVLGVLDILKAKPNLLISGINRGGNLGGDLTYSGTVSAAMEGTILGIPSFAISVASSSVKSFTFAAEFATSLAKVLFKKGLPPLTLLNVNIPNLEKKKIRGVEITSQSTQSYQGRLEKRTDLRKRAYYWLGGSTPNSYLKEGEDLWAVKKGKISLTPVHLDLTNYDLIEELKKWKIGV